jgi:Fic family protein
LKTKNELSRLSILDAEIEKVIAQSDQYKQSFLDANGERNDLLLKVKSLTSQIEGFDKTTRDLRDAKNLAETMLGTTQKQYSEQMEANTEMRRKLNELYILVGNVKAEKTKEIPQLQM